MRGTESEPSGPTTVRLSVNCTIRTRQRLDLRYRGGVKTGFRVLRFRDILYSRYIVCFPIANKTSKTIGEKLEQFVFQQFQSPRNIHSDVGINLQSKFLKETLSFYSIKLRKGVPHSPWSHGTVEVQNRWVQTLVRILCTQYRISWVRALPLACILLNSTKKPQLGDCSSYEILFGKEPAWKERSPTKLTPDEVLDPEKHFQLMQKQRRFCKTAVDKMLRNRVSEPNDQVLSKVR